MATKAFPMKRILPQLEWGRTWFIGDRRGFPGRKVTASGQVFLDSTGESDNSGGMTKTDLRIAARASDGEGSLDDPRKQAQRGRTVACTQLLRQSSGREPASKVPPQSSQATFAAE